MTGKNFFELLGYFKEYYVENQFIGMVNLEEKDRETMGYYGRKNEVLSEDIIFSKSKKIKAGTEVMTIVYPICGKMVRK